MAEIPESWGLKTEPTQDGKLNIIGKDDAGESYRVRTTSGPEVTDYDVKCLHEADRETYSSRDEGARAFVSSIVDEGKRRKKDWEDGFDLTEEAGRVAYAGFERRGHSSPFTGTTRKYRSGYEAWAKTLKDN